MNKCYVFIGPSGSGKTTLAHAIFSSQQKIITYTTRPHEKMKKITLITILFLKRPLKK